MAKTVTAGAKNSVYSDIAVDSLGDVFVAGSCDGTGEYGFGGDISAKGTVVYGNNALLVEYR